MLTPLLLLFPISLVLTWLVAQGIAGKPFDRALEYNVRALSQLVVVQDQRVRFVLPSSARELLRADATDQVFFQVLDPKGSLLGGEKDLPLPSIEDYIDSGEEVQLRDALFRGQEVKIAYKWMRLALPKPGLALVQVAETMDKRATLATEIVTGVMLPQFVMLPLAVLLIWLALVQAIKPLHRLENRMHQRKPDDLSALDMQGVPMELAPFVASVNGLLLRLKDSIATQKRFLADAAHQLKTPLAGLRMQADLAQREGASAEDLKQSLRQIGRSSVRATHTVNQLLALARAEAGSMVLSRRACDLAQLTLEVVKDAVQRSLDQHLDIGYEGLSALAPQDLIRGNATLLKEMVRNLLDNAMLYTPSSPELPGIVTVRVVHDPHTAELLLQVENSGPGIAPAQRELVFQPFYRVLGNTVDGSGLGLSIVAEIAQQHHAVIAITDGSPGHATPGVCFTVRFLR
jgi:two-component system sensor histidine kinase TctE